MSSTGTVSLASSALLAFVACGGGASNPDDSVVPDAPLGTVDASPVVDGGGAADASADAAGGPARLTAPALISITCAAEIPADGKTDCTTTITYPDGTPVYAGAVGVGLRGRSSSGFPKTQYALELRNPDGTDDDSVDLFGMGADADWVLNGMFIDRALLRNRLAYDLYRAMGHVAPDSAYAELTLNGDYLGVFHLCERIERGAERVDIPPDDGTGSSFIVKGSDVGYASTVQYNPWEGVYPKVQPAGVAERLATAEAAILVGDAGVWDVLDQGELIDFLILEETLKNNDAFWLSHHLYTRADGKLGLIPWDLDLTLGQPSYNDNERSDLWLAYRSALINTPAHAPGGPAALQARWAELRGGILATDALTARIDALRAEIGEDALARNWAVWDVTAIPDQTWFPLYDVASVDEEYMRVKTFLTERLAWIDANIAAY
jgi:hypothetical protein